MSLAGKTFYFNDTLDLSDPPSGSSLRVSFQYADDADIYDYLYFGFSDELGYGSDNPMQLITAYMGGSWLDQDYRTITFRDDPEDEEDLAALEGWMASNAEPVWNPDPYLVGWMNLFPPASRGKARFMALAEAIVQQAVDLANAVSQINTAYSFATAEGECLDQMAGVFGLSRLEGFGSAEVSDSDFRSYLLAKMVLWNWDGSNAGGEEMLTRFLPGCKFNDRQNGMIAASATAGYQWLRNCWVKVFPIPGGVGGTIVIPRVTM